MKRLIALFFLSMLCSVIAADAVDLFERARRYQDSEDWYSAIEAYQESLRVNPNHKQSYAGLAECFYSLGEFVQSLDQIEKAARFGKDDPMLLNLKAFNLVGLGKLDDARVLFSRILTIWPNDVQARFGKAEIELALGRTSSAAGLYQEALHRQPENRKALLSLALVSLESGKGELARDYIQKALRFHGENPQVFYIAGYLAARDGQYGEAENRLRSALALKPDYEEAEELLSALLFSQKRYAEVSELCDKRIERDRNISNAWYLKALVHQLSGRTDDAIRAAAVGVEIDPSDEILRAYLENLVIDHAPLEDTSRSKWAKWHGDRAHQFLDKNLSDQSLFSFRRALKIDPYNVALRKSYASLLLSRGLPSRHVEQLEFIQSLVKSDRTVNDSVESYKKMLQSSVQNRWKIDPLYLSKSHIQVGLFFVSDPENILHPEADKITTRMLAETLSYNQRIKVRYSEIPSESYSEAFRASRTSGDDYFAMLELRENEQDLSLVLDVYVSRTGALAERFTVFRTGNDRYSSSLRRMAQALTQALPVRAAVVGRYQADAVIDLGKTDGIKKGDEFEILAPGKARVSNEGFGLEYAPESIIGTITIAEVDEDVSLGRIDRNGVFDRVKAGDTVIPSVEKEKDPASAERLAGEKMTSPLFALLRSIR